MIVRQPEAALEAEPPHPQPSSRLAGDSAGHARVQEAIAALRYWVPSIADVAHVEESENADGWRLRLRPQLPGTSPFELVLRSDQTFDLKIAGEHYEGQTVPSLDILVPLAEAISAAHVIQRCSFTLATGALCLVETVVRLGNGSVWTGSRRIPPIADVTPPDGIECKELCFLPYRRPK